MTWSRLLFLQLARTIFPGSLVAPALNLCSRRRKFPRLEAGKPLWVLSPQSSARPPCSSWKFPRAASGRAASPLAPALWNRSGAARYRWDFGSAHNRAGLHWFRESRRFQASEVIKGWPPAFTASTEPLRELTTATVKYNTKKSRKSRCF